jgi:hypothetical protein
MNVSVVPVFFLAISFIRTITIISNFYASCRPIHEASRGGHTAILKFLIDNGADINARPKERGGTPLYYAKKNHGSSHSSVVFLESHGAIEVGPAKKNKHIKVDLSVMRVLLPVSPFFNTGSKLSYDTDFFVLYFRALGYSGAF